MTDVISAIIWEMRISDWINTLITWPSHYGHVARCNRCSYKMLILEDQYCSRHEKKLLRIKHSSSNCWGMLKVWYKYMAWNAFWYWVFFVSSHSTRNMWITWSSHYGHVALSNRGKRCSYKILIFKNYYCSPRLRNEHSSYKYWGM